MGTPLIHTERKIAANCCGNRLALAVLAALSLVGPACAQARRSPGLVLETGARHATCDVVTFTVDGQVLLTAGDDKVVRQWKVGKEGAIGEPGRILRWPILRERRGGIHAMALSPDPAGKHVAVTGFGVKEGLVMVLDRATGTVVHVLDDRLSAAVNWAIAWSKNGRFLVFGNEYGELFRWEPNAKGRALERFAERGGPGINRVRLIAFVDDRHFISVAQDGKVWRRDVTATATAPKEPIAAFDGLKDATLSAVAFSPATGRLAACREYYPGRALWLDIRPALLAGEPVKAKTNYLVIPQDDQTERYGWSVAFNAAGDKVAVGTRDANRVTKVPFARTTGGVAFVYSVVGQEATLLTPARGLDCGYAVDALAFRPGAEDQLATAGGPNHEVRVWRYGATSEKISEVRTPGSCLWSVSLDTGRNYLAWREGHNPTPAHPNDRGAGPWRYFKLDQRARQILSREPVGYTPTAPLETCDGWRVEPTKDSSVWRVIEPSRVAHELSDRTGLYHSAQNGIPRCYTFLPTTRTKPVRLAVGHQWGVSLYELRPGKVRLARYYSGHEGEVMAVSSAANGTLLVTASRDQTIACWSLEDWPYQGELGAGFKIEDGRVMVSHVAPGGPAWEMGLTDGDEILLVVSMDRNRKNAFLYDPRKDGIARYKLGKPPAGTHICDAKDLLNLLSHPEPLREHVFFWRHGKDAPEQGQRTTLPQRPLWRFFPTRQEEGSQWVLWRWRDYYYDTMSPRPDKLVGWHVFDEQNLKVTPAFHALADFGRRRDARGTSVEGFHDPDRVWKFLARTAHEPEKVIFAQIEPPRIELSRNLPLPDGANDLSLNLHVYPQDGRTPLQQISRVVLWLDDSRFETPIRFDPKTGTVKQAVVIPRTRLQTGLNRIKVVAFNREGGRAEEVVEVPYNAGGKPARTLRGLCVGINDYSKVKLGGDDLLIDLTCSVPDANLMHKVLEQQKGSALFQESIIKKLVNEEATAPEILSRLKQAAGLVGPNDWFVLFLSGHGVSEGQPGEFFFACAGARKADRKTLLTADALHQALRDMPCRKLIVLDTCHSGQVAASPIRELNKDGVEFRIFSSCKPHQQANEPTEKAIKVTKKALRLNGLFTQSIVGVLGWPDEVKSVRLNPVTDRELADKATDELQRLLKVLGLDENSQEPEFYPERLQMRGLELLSRP